MIKTTSPPTTIIIEEIDREFFSLIKSAIQNGDFVYFLSVADSAKKSPFLQQNITENKIIDIKSGGTDYYLFLKAGVCAHKIVDDIFDRFISQSKSLGVVKKLFGSSEIENMYKKALLSDLQRIIHHQMQINTIIHETTGIVVFYPKDDLWLYSDNSTFFSKSVVIKNLPGLRAFPKKFHNKIKDILYQFYPIFLLVRKVGIPAMRQNDKKRFKLGINANLPSLLGYNYHYIDFIVDDIYGFPKKDILFVDERYKKTADTSFVENGYAFYDSMNFREKLSYRFFLDIVLRRFIPAWTLCSFFALSEKSLFTRVTRTILSDFIKWNIFCECYSLEKHVTVLLEDTVSKNLILTENGIQTWYIYPDNYTLDYHTGWTEKESVSFWSFAFMKYDHAVVFGNKTRRYFFGHRNTIGKYHCTGVLSAQRIREIIEGQIPSDLPLLIKEKKITGKIVGVFDTTFVDHGPLKVKDGIKFGKDLLQLLKDIPEISLIFKEKKFLHLTPLLTSVYQQLEQHPRCLVIRKTDDDPIFSTEVIAQSDLVISAAYSSTGAEALGAKVKAIYYDIAGTDIGEQYYFNRFPNLVAHNYDELIRLVKYWLYEITPEEFESYLMTYVKDEIDPYMDGKAIDRLQNLLRND